MAFDGLYLSKIVQELNETILGFRADKIHQPEKDEIIMSFRGRDGVKKLLLTSSADHARVHLTKESKQNPKTAPLFTMVLRKYIQSSRLMEICQPHGDRIIEFTFESTDEMGFHSNYLLIAELMGRHSNIILVRQRDMKIMECIKHVGADQNSYRILLPGATYISPPSQDKLNPWDFTAQDVIESLSGQDPAKVNPASLFSGLSKHTGLLLKSYLEDSDLETKEDYGNAMKSLFNGIRQTPQATVYYEDRHPKDLTLIAFKEEEGLEKKVFASPSEALETYLGQKDLVHRVRERSQDILKILNANLDRLRRKITILEDVLEKSEKKESLVQYGELLKANLFQLPNQAKEVTVVDYYDEAQPEIKIQLDENKTVSENMQNFFHRYAKLKRSEANAKEQLVLAREEEDYLTSVADSVMRSEEPSDIEEIRQELIHAGYIRFRRNKSKKEAPSKPMVFRSSQGLPIYVGKNNNQNDQLTMKFADKQDTWLHTKGYPGSHVIIHSKEVDEETLLEAANLAAWFSKAQAGTKVPVDYTLVKNVKKPNGSKPGMVIYSTNQTIFVDPDQPRLERI